MKYFFVSIIFLAACKKAENRHCFKSIGKEIVKEISLDDFDKLELYEHIEFVLVQDSVSKVIISGGKNLLKDISFNVSDKILIVKNNNRCHFLRRYDKVVKAEIHFINLSELTYKGTESVTNKDTLNLTWFALGVSDGSGSVKLNLNADIINAYSSSYTDFTLAGKVNYAEFTIRSNSFCDTYGLKVKNSLNVISSSMGLTKVNADKSELKAEINNGGNIYYIGDPSIKVYNKYGNGELIDKN